MRVNQQILSKKSGKYSRLCTEISTYQPEKAPLRRKMKFYNKISEHL